nr:MAG: ORF5 [Army ant associated sopolycivirus 1]
MASSNKLSPVKKFTLYTKIKNEIRSALRKENVWTHLTPSGLLKRFSIDVTKKVLPVRGTPFAPIDYTLADVVSLFNHLELESKPSFNGKRLRDSPMFSEPLSVLIPPQEEDVELTYRKGDFNSYLELYETKQSRYLARQSHKIQGAFKYDQWSTYVLLLDLSLNFVAYHPVLKLKEYLHETLKQLEYARIDPNGLYTFILHLAIRGVAKPSALAISAAWKKAWSLRTPAERYFLSEHFYSGTSYPDVEAMQQSCLTEIKLAISLLRNETKLARISYVPAKTLLNSELILFSTWYHGIYKQMSESERYRSLRGLPLIIKEEKNKPYMPSKHTCYNGNNRLIRELILDGKIDSYCEKCKEEAIKIEAEPTMLAGMAKDAISAGITESIPQVQEAISNTITQTLTKSETVESLKTLTSEAAKPVIDDMVTKLDQLKDKTVDELKTAVEPVLNESLGTFSSLDGIMSYLKDTMNSIVKMIPIELFNKIGIKINIESMIGVFKYYILYINVESTFIKSALFVLMLKEIGVFDLLSKFGTTILTWMKSFKTALPEEPQLAESINAEPTSCMDWISTIMKMIQGHLPGVTICTFIALALTIIFKITMTSSKTPLQRKDHTSVYGYVLEGFKNMHFVGAGMFGLERIIKYVSIVVDAITKWVSHYIFGNVSDERKNEKAVSLWYGKLQYFKTEMGRAAIRVSEKVMCMAERIQPDGLAFIHAIAEDPKYVSRDTAMLVQRSQKDAAELASFCFRIRAMSNFQPAMFHIQFVGKPGIGKSKLTEALISKLSEQIFPEDDKITHFSYNPNLDHFDGYQQQKFMIIDDLFRFNEPKHMSLLIGLITNTPVILPMAHLEEKGLQLQSDILISSTNTPYPEAKDVFCMDAVHRRRHVLIEVTADPDVMDKANSMFSMELFKKSEKYKGKNPADFPHLKFSLLKPVIEPCEDTIKHTTNSEVKYFRETLDKIRELNQTHKFNSEYFKSNDKIPDGVSYPCKDWQFPELITNIVGRYFALRKAEQKMTRKQKYSQVMDCFADIDQIQNQIAELPSSYSLDRKLELISKHYLDASYAYGIDDPLGEKIYLEDNFMNSIPELDGLENINKELEKLLTEDEAEPTGLSDISDATDTFFNAIDQNAERIKIIEEYITNYTPVGMELYRLQSIIRSLQTNSYHDLSIEEKEAVDAIIDKKIEDDEYPLESEVYVNGSPHNELSVHSPPAPFRELFDIPKFDQKPSLKKTRRALIMDRAVKVAERKLTNDGVGNWRDTPKGKKFYLDVQDKYMKDYINEDLDFLDLKMKKLGEGYLPRTMPEFKKKEMRYKEIVDKIKEAGPETFNIDALAFRKMLNFMDELEQDQAKIMIPRVDLFHRQRQGAQTNIPRSWLKRFVLLDGEWKIDLTDMYINQVTDLPGSSGSSPHPLVNILTSNYKFVIAMQEFSMMNSQQQEYLVRHARWTLKYLPNLIYHNWRPMHRRISDYIKTKVQTFVYNPR